MHLQTGQSFAAQLERAGFRGDRLSAWALQVDYQKPYSRFVACADSADITCNGPKQDEARWVQGLAALQLGMPEMNAIMTDVTNMAAFNSFVLGELPALPRQQGEDLLASFGLLGHIIEFGAEQADYGRWSVLDGESGGVSRRLFTAQHLRLSLHEMGMYTDHVQAAIDTDDFEGNFS